jgi:hypothetical protein
MSTKKDDSDEIVELPEIDNRTSGALKMLPVQDAPRTGKNDLTVKRGPGRPRKVERMPQTSDLEYHAEMIVEKQKFIENDAVVQALARHAEPIEVIRIVKAEVARESAAIEFQRIENEKRGRDVADISKKRIEALTKVAALELEAAKLGVNAVDLKSERMQRIFKFWVERIQEVAAEVLQPEQIELLFNRLQTELEGWEDRAAEETAT